MDFELNWIESFKMYIKILQINILNIIIDFEEWAGINYFPIDVIINEM